jgi:tetratricopeptide (TPR) repeat protein
VEFLLRAGRQAGRAFANQEALATYGRVLDLLGDNDSSGEDAPEWRDEAAIEAHREMGHILSLTGRYAEARRSYDQALGMLSPGRRLRRARFQRHIATAWDEEGRHDRAAEAYRRAETTLGTTPSDPLVDWWQEWLEFQNRRMWRYYGLNRPQEMAELAQEMRPVVEQYGTAGQRGAFHQSLALLGLRQDRYLPRDSTVDHIRAGLAAFREAGDLAAVVLALSGLGFALLWQGCLDEAETEMQAGLALAERIGDFTIQARNLTYLTVLFRRRGDVVRVRDFAERTLKLISEKEMWEYEGLIQANLAWAAWQDGDQAATLAAAETARDLWQRAPLASPFQWTALLPLIDISMAQGQLSEALGHARRMLDDSQQRLPEELVAEVNRAVGAAESGKPEAAAGYLSRIVDLARQFGYL